MRILLPTLIAALLSTSMAHAQTPVSTVPTPPYRYVDDRGVINWAQSIHLVPPAYASRATTPTFGDPSVFPQVPPYVRPATPSAISLSVEHQSNVPSLGPWVSQVRRLVSTAWKGRGQDGPQPMLTFYILRDGRLSIPDVDRSSGDLAYDLKARDALISLRRLPPLPRDFSGARLHVKLAFAHVK